MTELAEKIRADLKAGRSPKDFTDPIKGVSLLHLCHHLDDLELVSFLTKHLDVNAYDCNQNTPLHYAIPTCGMQMITVLLEAGANPYLEDMHGKTGFDLAREEGIEEDFMAVVHRIATEKRKRVSGHIDSGQPRPKGSTPKL